MGLIKLAGISTARSSSLFTLVQTRLAQIKIISIALKASAVTALAPPILVLHQELKTTPVPHLFLDDLQLHRKVPLASSIFQSKSNLHGPCSPPTLSTISMLPNSIATFHGLMMTKERETCASRTAPALSRFTPPFMR